MSESASIEERLLRAIYRVLYPLVKMLLRNGVTAQAFQEVTRKVFVDVADAEFRIDGKAQTLARVSVLTGLNRKEVSRLHKLDNVTNEDKAWWNRAGKVMDGWLTDRDFHTSAGFPLDLPFAGATPSFSDLVKRYSGDMYPRSVADELLRLGVINEHEGVLSMAKRGYVPGSDPSTLIDGMGVDVAEMIETIDHNIQNREDPRLQYKVVADNLPDHHIEAFRAYSRKVSLDAIDNIRQWLIEHDAGSDKTSNAGRWQAGVGVFQILDQPEDNNLPQDESKGGVE